MYKTVLFDLDGTLLDTLDDLADSVNFVLRERGYPLHTREEICRFVGNGVALLMRRALPDDVTVEEAATCLTLFKEHYAVHMQDKTAPYRGVTALLGRLREAGCRVAVISNKFDRAVKELCACYFPGLVDVAVGESESVRRKPSPDGVLAAMHLLGGTCEDSVYIGDSDVDIVTAQNAGLPCVCVAWGFRLFEELQAAGAERIVRTTEELGSVLLGK